MATLGHHRAVAAPDRGVLDGHDDRNVLGRSTSRPRKTSEVCSTNGNWRRVRNAHLRAGPAASRNVEHNPPKPSAIGHARPAQTTQVPQVGQLKSTPTLKIGPRHQCRHDRDAPRFCFALHEEPLLLPNLPGNCQSRIVAQIARTPFPPAQSLGHRPSQRCGDEPVDARWNGVRSAGLYRLRPPTRTATCCRDGSIHARRGGQLAPSNIPQPERQGSACQVSAQTRPQQPRRPRGKAKDETSQQPKEHCLKPETHCHQAHRLPHKGSSGRSR